MKAFTVMWRTIRALYEDLLLWVWLSVLWWIGGLPGAASGAGDSRHPQCRQPRRQLSAGRERILLGRGESDDRKELVIAGHKPTLDRWSRSEHPLLRGQYRQVGPT